MQKSALLGRSILQVGPPPTHWGARRTPSSRRCRGTGGLRRAPVENRGSGSSGRVGRRCVRECLMTKFMYVERL